MPPAELAAAGPLLGVRGNADAPYTDWSKYLLSALNMYWRDSEGMSSAMERPGFALLNESAVIGDGSACQGCHTHVNVTTGNWYSFFVVKGKLYRSNSTFDTYTDVSPVGITIDNGTVNHARVSFASVGASLVVSDGVNRPWVMSNFSSTPVTGAYIDIDGAAGAWSAYGPPTVYQDSVFFIASTVPSGSPVTENIGIVWSEPNQPTVGYTQTGYADFWNLIETGSENVTAILGTNIGLFYWREASIGVLAGTPSVNFSTTGTRDARGVGLGTTSPWAVTQFNNNIFFLDNYGRPYMMPLLGQPQAIWKNCEAVWSTMLTSPEFNLPYHTHAARCPGTNLVAMWNKLGSGTDPIIALVFDGDTGEHHGQWAIYGQGSYGQGIGVSTVAVMIDRNGLAILICVGGLALNASGSYVWEFLRTDNATPLDKATSIDTQVVTGYLGYSAERLIVPDLARIVSRTSDAMSVTLGTNYSASAATATVTPVAGANSSQFSVTVGLPGTISRFAQLTVKGPSVPTFNNPWGIQRIELYGSLATVGPDDA